MPATGEEALLPFTPPNIREKTISAVFDGGQVSADVTERFVAQPAPPTYNAQLIAPAGEHGRDRDEQKTDERVAPAFRTPMAWDRRQDLPKAVRLRCCRIYSRLSKGNFLRERNCLQPMTPAENWSPVSEPNRPVRARPNIAAQPRL